MWILKTLKKDLSFIFLPGIIFYIWVSLLSIINIPFKDHIFITLSIMALVIVDTGHVYTTFLRTVKKPNSLTIYLRIPILVFIFFFIWHYLKVPHLWKFVFYTTFYHYLKQIYGISKWYQTLNKNYLKIFDYLVYLSTVIPFAALHFRNNFNPNYYSATDLFFYPNTTVFNSLIVAECLVFFTWITFEVRQYKISKKIEKNRIFFFLSNALLYSTCFFTTISASKLLLCFIMAHGVPYMFLISTSLVKTKRIQKSFLKVSMIVLFLATFFGTTEYLLEEKFLIINNDYLLYSSFISSLFIAIYLTPLFTHFLYDAKIWKKDHPDSKLVY